MRRRGSRAALSESGPFGQAGGATSPSESLMEICLEEGEILEDADSQSYWSGIWNAVQTHDKPADAVAPLLQQILVNMDFSRRQAALDWQDSFGRTLMHVAASRGKADMVSLLLQLGASPELGDVRGNTPLSLAACGCHSSCVLLLLQHRSPGAPMPQDVLGKRPLDWALAHLRILRRDHAPRMAVLESLHQIVAVLQQAESDSTVQSRLNDLSSHIAVTGEVTESELDELEGMLSKLCL